MYVHMYITLQHIFLHTTTTYVLIFIAIEMQNIHSNKQINKCM